MSANFTPQQQALAIKTAQDAGLQVGARGNLKDLISKGWRATYSELFGQSFVDSLDSVETDDKHHSEAIEWHWNARTALLEGRRPPHDEFAYFPIWARGHMKTTLAEHMVCIDAVLSYAYGERGFCLYIGREKDKVTLNISNIEALFGLPQVVKYAPGLSQVSHDKDTNQQGRWTAFLIQTQTNYTVKAATVESAQAGAKIKDTRVTFFVPDDIDDRDESPVQAETKYRKLTGEILPMRQENTLTFFAQNLINRFSTMYRIYKGQSLALANRKMTKPIPAVRGLVTERVTLPNGKIQDKMIAGKSTWRGWSEQRIQDEIDTSTLPVFLTEMQHEVEQSKEGRFHKVYTDEIHAISHSQFAAVYGQDAWKQWYKVVYSDWSRTKTKYHANVAGYLAVSSANTKYPGFTFCIPFSFPADTQPEDVAERLLSVLTPYAYGTEGNQVTWKQLIDEAWKRLNADTHYTSVSGKLAYRTDFYKKAIPQYSRKVLSAYNVRIGVNSHSEDKVREMLNHGFGFAFKPSNPGKTDAVEEIDAAMKFDMNEDHIFKLGTKGYTRWYVLCKDDTSKEPELVNGVLVYPPVPYPDVLDPKDLHDDDLFRYQMVERRFRAPKLTETGEQIDENEKLNDDFGQGLQMAYFKNLLKNLPLTENEKIDWLIPVDTREAFTSATTPEEKLTSALTLEFERDVAMEKLYPFNFYDELE